ncbi:molybdenum cofactor biosysynthesis protein [Sphingomonas sp. DBB INV C78]|uniref:MOSC domain-containing protein n=1 Tax=Sphingomonas sp. DBB INV C78 TaxID=3349434 RepID=UPI0036D3BE01
MTGRLLGIARHARPRGPMETADRVSVTLDGGIEGDHRGKRKPGGTGRRQVTVITRADWDAAMADLAGPQLDWWVRRANLLIDGVDLPQQTGARLHFAGGVILEITGECDPCSRMDEIAPGLKTALAPDWRGGVTARVLADGDLAIGDEVRIEHP